MRPLGIYTVCNDTMAQQLIALLNSIEVNAGNDMPVYVLPYDDHITQVREVIAGRDQVTLVDEPETIAHWDAFALAAWSAHPYALTAWQAKYGWAGVYRLGMHRRFAAFDGPCERFLYLDADMLVLDTLAPVFAALDLYDFVVFDDQYKAPQHVYHLESARLDEVFGEARVHSEVFCAGFVASKRGVIGQEQQDQVVARLREGEAGVLYLGAPDQSLLNYMVMRLEAPTVNLHRLPPEGERIRTCATVPDLETRAAVLFDHGRRLPFLHYIGIPAWVFNRLCQGENILFPYRDLWMHYRYLSEPGAKPLLQGRPKPFQPSPGRPRRLGQRWRQRWRTLWEGQP